MYFRCQYFQIACWGHYIDIQPLSSLRAAQTTQALTASVNFFRKHGIILDTLRMNNQQSYDLRETARILKLKMEFIASEVKRPNRAERAIRTAKNHIIATRAGFHPDCSHAYLDLIHPFEYNDSISAYHGVHGKRFNFNHHPIAPLGCKVLTDRINNYVYRIQVYHSMSIADGDPAFDYLKFTRYNLKITYTVNQYA